MSFRITILFLSIAYLSIGQRNTIPIAPDYSQLKYWAAHPNKDSPALAVPGKGKINVDNLLDVDIFFIHPTSFTEKDRKGWNADLGNTFLNKRTDSYVIKNQASIFNQIGKIYAPRYRQAHIGAYWLPIGDKRQEIFDIAYDDVKAAFLHFIENFNDGKPYILATHSQGTTHGKRLIKEVIQMDKSIQERLVVAYLVGMDVKQDEFSQIQPCASPQETGCFTSWRTIRRDFDPPSYFPIGNEFVATNPLTWDDNNKAGGKERHLGAIFKRFNKIHTNALEAESKDGILYVCRPKFPFSFLFKWTNYHILDYNLFYFNVQNNARLRTVSFLNK
ncbi:MAG: DUF3089 domain-containing protein [Saprospiraceae bacterium]